MTEFVLDRFALQELHVVDHQQINVAQGFLEGQRIIVANGGCKAPHEIFSGQIDDARLALAFLRRQGDGLKQMGLAKPYIGMNKQRIETHRAAAGLGDGLCRGQRDAIGCAFDKGAEGIATIQR